MRTRSDAGVTHVLGAVLAAVVMLGAVAFVATYEAPATSIAPASVELQRAAEDALLMLRSTPAEQEGLGTDLLSVLVARCLQDDCGELTRRLDRLLPPGAEYAVHLSNGEAMTPVHAPRAPPGEAVTAEALVAPDWTYAFLGTGLDEVMPGTDPLLVHALPVWQGRALTRGGVPLQVVVHASRVADGSDYVLKAASALDATGGGAALHFLDAGAPAATLDLRARTLLAPHGEPVTVDLALRVLAAPGTTLPEGTQLTLHLPRAWTARLDPAQNPGWALVQDGLDRNGSAGASSLVARLATPLEDGARALTVQATYHRDASDAYVLRAELGRGASARAAVVVLADGNPGGSTFATPGAYLTHPGPTGAGAADTWTLAVLAPRAPAAGLSDALVVTRVDVTALDGAPVFAGVAGLSGGGAWTATPTRLTWTGAASATPASPLALTFQVEAATLPGAGLARSGFAPAVDVGGAVVPLLDETSPGLYRAAPVPATGKYGGYNGTTHGAKTTHLATSATQHVGLPIEGEVAYGTGPFVGLRDAVFGSAVQPATHEVRAGDDLEVHVNVQALMLQAAYANVVPTVTLRVYAPWSGATRVPLHEETLYGGGVGLTPGAFLASLDGNGDGAPGPTDAGRLTATLRTKAGWPHGPYVLEAEVTWLERVVPEGGGPAQDLTRAVRVYDAFDLVNRNGELPASPLYRAHLTVWMRDWR